MKKIFITLSLICFAWASQAQDLKVKASGQTNLKIQSTSNSPSLELINGSDEFGNGSRDWKIVNDAGVFEFQTKESGGSVSTPFLLRPTSAWVNNALFVGEYIAGGVSNSNLYLNGSHSGGSVSHDLRIDPAGKIGVNGYESDTRFNIQAGFSDDKFFSVRRTDGVLGFWVAAPVGGDIYPKAYVHGHFDVAGTLSKGGGSFKIDHPLDPANKYLYHSFVESPDMMNVYNGNLTTDAQGKAVVTLPEYFETLNRDFRYQLTCIGTFAQAIVTEEVEGNRFAVQTSEPNVKVSWQVTGVRQDPWAEANRIPESVDKSAEEKGRYLHPAAYGQPESKSIYYEEGKPEGK